MANEKRLIDAYALSKSVSGIGKDIKRPRAVELACLCLIADAPTVDAVEVVHGYTTIADNPTKVLLDRKCGICGQLMLATDNYCSMCGARNEGEKIDGLLFADMEEIIDA